MTWYAHTTAAFSFLTICLSLEKHSKSNPFFNPSAKFNPFKKEYNLSKSIPRSEVDLPVKYQHLLNMFCLLHVLFWSDYLLTDSFYIYSVVVYCVEDYHWLSSNVYVGWRNAYLHCIDSGVS